MPIKKLKLSEITIEPALRSRVKISGEVIAEYADKIKAGVAFPPGRVFRVKLKDEFGSVTESLLLTSGEHRLEAHRVAGLDEMEFEVKSGTQADALLDALGSNDDHGLRLTNADKRHKVLVCLQNLEGIPGSSNSDRYIADACSVSAPLVSEVREEWEAERAAAGAEAPKQRRSRSGHAVPVNTKSDEVARGREEKARMKAARKKAKIDAENAAAEAKTFTPEFTAVIAETATYKSLVTYWEAASKDVRSAFLLFIGV